MPCSEAVRPTRLGTQISARPRRATAQAHSAISPRFAMSTEVSDFAGAIVEWQRPPGVARSRREKRLDFRRARIFG
jgi:hypothetical protein